MLGKKRFFGKVLYAVIQGLSEIFNERAAAGGACLVEKHAVHGVILYLDAFHILSADVQNTVYLRIEEGCGRIMGDGLHLALVQHQGGFDQRLAVACGAGIGDAGRVRHLLIDLLDSPDGGGQGASVVVAVEGIQKRAVFAHHGRFGSGRTGVDAQIAVALICRKIGGCYVVDALAFQERIIFLLAGEQGLHAGHLKIHLHAGIQTLFQPLERNR